VAGFGVNGVKPLDSGSTVSVTFKQTREFTFFYLLQPIIYGISFIDLTSKYL
jgi:hypothetical protein